MVYVYCDYKHTVTHSEFELLSSIAQQLASQRECTPQIVSEFLDKNAVKKRNPTGAEWISLIRDLICDFEKTYIFVDALVSILPVTDFQDSHW